MSWENISQYVKVMGYNHISTAFRNHQWNSGESLANATMMPQYQPSVGNSIDSGLDFVREKSAGF
jgi:hypothetical protein